MATTLPVRETDQTPEEFVDLLGKTVQVLGDPNVSELDRVKLAATFPVSSLIDFTVNVMRDLHTIGARSAAKLDKDDGAALATAIVAVSLITRTLVERLIVDNDLRDEFTES